MTRFPRVSRSLYRGRLWRSRSGAHRPLPPGAASPAPAAAPPPDPFRRSRSAGAGPRGPDTEPAPNRFPLGPPPRPAPCLFLLPRPPAPCSQRRHSPQLAPAAPGPIKAAGGRRRGPPRPRGSGGRAAGPGRAREAAAAAAWGAPGGGEAACGLPRRLCVLLHRAQLGDGVLGSLGNSREQQGVRASRCAQGGGCSGRSIVPTLLLAAALLQKKHSSQPGSSGAVCLHGVLKPKAVRLK